MFNFNANSIFRKNDKKLQDLSYSDGHGCEKNHLGFAQLYFSLAYLQKPENIVIIGSGEGFVPRILREAQIASNNAQGKTYVIDIGKNDGALPHKLHHKKCLFRKLYPEIEVLKFKSYPDELNFKKKKKY